MILAIIIAIYVESFSFSGLWPEELPGSVLPAEPRPGSECNPCTRTSIPVHSTNRHTPAHSASVLRHEAPAPLCQPVSWLVACLGTNVHFRARWADRSGSTDTVAIHTLVCRCQDT